MSDLRFFADTMHQVIELEARLKEINLNAARYADACAREREAALPIISGLISRSFHQANEGLCAVNAILARGQK